MAATMALFMALEERMRGTLDGVEGLLGCPLHLPALQFYGSGLAAALPEQHALAVQTLWHASNVLRETVNAFSAPILKGWANGLTHSASMYKFIGKMQL